MAEHVVADRHALVPASDSNLEPIGTHKYLLVVALAAVALAGFLWRSPLAPIIEPDSPGYIDFASSRPVGYPLLLQLAGVQGALILQPLLAAFALAYFGCELLRLTRSVPLTYATMLAIAFNPHLLVYHHRIMSESLYVTLVMIFLGLIMHLARKPTPGWMAVTSTVAGVMISVRLAAWFLLPLLVLAVLMLRARVSTTAPWLAAAVVPLLAVTFAEHQFRSAWHDGKIVSLLDVAFYGKAGMIEAPAMGDETPAARLLEHDYAAVRKIIDQSPDAAIRRFLTINYETCIEFTCTSARGVDAASGTARAAALPRIIANPIGYLKLAWLHYTALWLPYGVLHPTEAPVINAFIAAHRPMPFEREVDVLKQDIRPFHTATVMQPVMRLLGLLTTVLTLAGLISVVVPRALSPTLVVALLCALAVQGAFVLVALTGVGIPRYMLAMWPALMLMLACLASAGLTCTPQCPCAVSRTTSRAE